MIRWKYLIPRLIILVLILALLWVGTDPVLRWSLIHGSQAVTGAKVEIGDLQADFRNGEIRLTDIEIADPRNPMKNLFQADEATLKLDPGRILHKEFVIESSRMRQMQFSTPRTESGALTSNQRTNYKVKSWIPQGLRAEFNRMGELFVDQFKSRAIREFKDQFETPAVAEKIRTQWPQEFERQFGRAQLTKKRIELIRQAISQTGDNPLRDLERIPVLIQDLETLLKQLAGTKTEINRLKQQFQNDRRLLAQAKQRDHAKIRQIKSINQVDGKTISRLLLGEYQTSQIEEVMSWVAWFRSVVPDPETDFYPVRSRGLDVKFPGVKRFPRFLVKSVELDGEGNVSGNHYRFSGKAFNLTTQPRLHDQPASFELRAKGDTNVFVAASIDRRGIQEIDQITIRCPGIDVPGHSLGNDDFMKVAVSPGKLNANIDMTITDDVIDGVIEFQRDDVMMHVQKLHEVAGGQQMATSLDRELSDLNGFTAKVRLTGKIEELDIEIESDLGDRFASAMQTVMQRSAQHLVDRQLARLETVYQAELQKLDDQIGRQFDQLSNLVRNNSSVIAELQRIVPSIGNLKIR